MPAESGPSHLWDAPLTESTYEANIRTRLDKI